MEKAYKLIEELQTIYNKELEYEVINNELDARITYITIKNIYIVDDIVINKIQEYTKSFYIDTNYKKIGLILTIIMIEYIHLNDLYEDINEKTSGNMVSNNIQNNRI